MNTEFHYYAVYTAARLAQFTPAQAETVAYASQYVDDATEHEPVDLGPAARKIVPNGVRLDASGNIDPICTAHSMLQIIQAGLDPEVHKTVYVPFHFLPAKAKGSNGTYQSYKVVADSENAKALVASALTLLEKNPTGDAELVKLGVALHTYADTWSHEHFAGVHSKAHNDLSEVQSFDGHSWGIPDAETLFTQIVAPTVGHAQAFHLPDEVGTVWSCKRGGDLFTSNNSQRFTVAASRIYEHLAIITGAPAWTPYLTNQFIACMDDKQHAGINRWTAHFGKIVGSYPDYDNSKWKKSALAGLDAKWFWFHKAALEQRSAY